MVANTGFTATYSADDNKIRLAASSRLDPDTYARVKAAGFAWAPKLDLFIAPAWTPDREDLALELAGDIGDEDSSLMARAEERARRFDGYHQRRMQEAERARQGVSAIADNIPLGQPILKGHHSERHARRDQQRIVNGMHKTVHLWRTAQYWEDRAASAIQHAKHKEKPAVRARRIKGLEADKRKHERDKAESDKCLRLWNAIESGKDGQPVSQDVLLARARYIANQCHLIVSREGGVWSAWDVLRPEDERYRACPSMTVQQVQEIARQVYPAHIACCDRWLAHLENRLTYERAMLADAGGTVADRTRPEKGGACKCWASPRGAWSYIQKVNKVSVTVLDSWHEGEPTFKRTIPFDKLSAVLSLARVTELRQLGALRDTDNGIGFYMDEQPQPERETLPAAVPQATAAEAQVSATSAAAGVVDENPTVRMVLDIFEGRVERVEERPAR